MTIEVKQGHDYRLGTEIAAEVTLHYCVVGPAGRGVDKQNKGHMIAMTTTSNTEYFQQLYAVLRLRPGFPWPAGYVRGASLHNPLS